MVADKQRWQTDIFGDIAKGFDAHMAPHTDPLSTRLAAVKARKHPWNIVSTAAIIGTAVITFSAWGMNEVWGWISALTGGTVSVMSLRKAGVKNNALKSARADVQDYIFDNIMPITTQDAREGDADIINRFQEAGAFGVYDDVKNCTAYVPRPLDDDFKSDTLASDTLAPDPVLSHIDLTRTETEHYTDSQGRSQTRQKTVPVFNGIIFDMPFVRSGSDSAHMARTLITTRRAKTPRGVFARQRNERVLKMEPIKTSSLNFNKRFHVLADDQTLSHAVLDPDQIMRWTNLCDDLRAEFGKRTTIFALVMGGRMWVAVGTGPLADVNGKSGAMAKLSPKMTQLARQLSTRHVFARHLDLNRPAAFPWEG